MSRPSQWTACDLDVFLGAAEGTRLEVAWHLAASAGLRVGELLALRWADVDLWAARVEVHQALPGVSYSALLPSPGRRRERVITINSDLVNRLGEHRTRQDTERTEWGSECHDRGLILCRENGEPLHPRSLARAFAGICERAGLEPSPTASIRGLYGAVRPHRSARP